MVVTFEYLGKTYARFSPDDALAAGIPHAVVDQAVADKKWQGVRATRDLRIKETDWTQMSDSPLAQAKRDEFATYRQALRDIPQTYSDPDAVVWPPVPEV